MKHLSIALILGILILMAALLSACDVTKAAAPLVLPTQAKVAQTDVNAPKQVCCASTPTEDTEPGFYYDRQVPADVIGTFKTLTLHYLGSAKGIHKIIAVRYPRMAWAVNIERGVIYVNLALTHCKTKSAWCVAGKIDHAKALAYRYAQQAIWPMWKRNRNIGDTRAYGTWQRLGIALAGAVR